MKIPKEIVEQFNKYDSFLSHIHVGPDPDTIGSNLALKLGLEQLGKVVNIYSEDELIKIAFYLPEADGIKQMSLTTALATYDFNAYVALDTAAPKMMTHLSTIPVIHKPLICLDHHPDNSLKSTFSFIDPEACSASEIVYQLLKELKVEITPEIAECLLFGVLGDTVTLQGSNTNSRVLRLAADLVDSGADYGKAILALNRSFTAAEMAGYGHLLKSQVIDDESHFVYYTMDNKTYQEVGREMTISVFANLMATKIIGTKFGAVLVETEPNMVKGSLRSRISDFDVSQVAHLLGGGGHKAASAFRLEKTMKNAEKEFLNAVSYLKSKGKL